MSNAFLLILVICLGALGTFIGVIAAIVFVIKKRKRLAFVSAVFSLILFVSCLFAAVLFAYKSYQVVNRKIIEVTEQGYDVDTPDTVKNRKGFERHLGILPGENVSRIFYFADELGADCRYQLSFKCDPVTIENIIAVLGLVRSEEFHGLAPHEKLFWWPLGATEGRDFWMKGSAGQYSWELWYSESDHMAYYQEYSL